MSRLPDNFIQSLEGLEGFSKADFLRVHEDRKAITSIRLNPMKPTAATNDLPIEDIVPWCPEGRYLTVRPSFTFDPVFHGGAYYVQEASSMFLQQIIEQIRKDKEPQKVLDVCAAPGGKSTLLAGALPHSFIVSNEVIKTRVGILAENISKWGSDNVMVTNNDPKDFSRLQGFFDLMVVDAPCSGSGLFRKDEKAVDEWSEANAALCSMRQKRILADVIGSLQQNGYLIYSTCSYSKDEDEDICDWILDEFKLVAVEVEIDDSWGIVKTLSERHKVPGYRFYPDKVKGEGFFVACFRQANVVDEYYGYYDKPDVAKNTRAMVSGLLKSPKDYLLRKQKELIVAFPAKWYEEYEAISKTLNIRKSGVAIGTIKGNDLVPHHELALSALLASDVQYVDVSKEQALQYLRKKEVEVGISGKGWTLCRYEDIQLGWMKVLPNRVNNYYPTEWRILKD